jgi:ribosomal protein S18 acetylase RimI-like enzyme
MHPSPSRIIYRTEPTSEDAVAIERLVAATGFFTEEEVAIARELVDERLAKGTASGYEFILADLDGILVGYSCYGPIAGTDHSYDLYWIAVSPNQQRGGIGRQILAETEAVIGQRTKARIYIETSGKSQYQPTQSFYEKNGYVLEARLVDFYRDEDDKLIYVKAIKQSHRE